MRTKILNNVKRIVVKIGSSIITTDTGYLDPAKVERIVQQIGELMRTYEKEVIVVSSGAIACGMGVLQMKKRPSDLAELQAAAAIGQGKLMHIYETLFAALGYHTAQILLTIDGVHHRTRYLNARNTIHSLLRLHVVPIVNENDSVATEEIRFGDNDNLSGQVAMLANADLLIMLSDVDGFCVTEKTTCSVMHTIDTADNELRKHLHEVQDGKTVGGMRSKLDTGFMMMKMGLPTIIANGKTDGILAAIITGTEVGTLFLPSAKRQGAKKRWLAFTATSTTAGSISVDEGAYRALAERGKSLLATGITGVKGEFKFGDAVNILSHEGKEFAKGITNYSHNDIERIKGKKSGEIKDILGELSYVEVVHRDNMIIVE